MVAVAMNTPLSLMIVAALMLPSPLTEAASPRALLIEARNLAYDGNYRNDQAGLRSAIATLDPLAKTTEAAYAYYYLSWTYWALAASQVQQQEVRGALESANLAVEHARSGLAARDQDPEFYTALANALIVVAVLDRTRFSEVAPELAAVRRKALQLGPNNPRTVLMDAGMIFNTPPAIGDQRERGLARWQEALRLFEVEAALTTTDTIAPRWGHALAYGWMASLYLRLSPPQKQQAQEAVDVALRMRPDFWYVREQVLPQLR
jgi:tetratricopeptide (TPR) repeat protein